MQDIFQKAHEQRRRCEWFFTSGGTNAVYYRAPAYAKKTDIWPPLSKDLRLDGVLGEVQSEDLVQGPSNVIDEGEDVGGAVTSKHLLTYHGASMPDLKVVRQLLEAPNIAIYNRSYYDFEAEGRASSSSARPEAPNDTICNRSYYDFEAEGRASSSLAQSESTLQTSSPESPDSRVNSDSVLIDCEQLSTWAGSPYDLSPQILPDTQVRSRYQSNVIKRDTSWEEPNDEWYSYAHSSDSQHKNQVTAQEELYSPLHKGRTIRILNLHPGSPDDPIRCDFHYIDLQRAFAKYEALSYVWNSHVLDHDRETKPTITCNGYEKEITANLEDALKHIRSSTAMKKLWVDAICINQEDHDERSHQISLMGSIYSRASQVIIWAGERIYQKVWYDERERRLSRYPAEFEDARAERAFGAICEIVNKWRQMKGKKPIASFSIPSPDDAGRIVHLKTFQGASMTLQRCQDSNGLLAALEDRFGSHNPGPQQYEDLGIDSTPQTALDSQFWLALQDLFARSWFWRVWIIQEVVLAKHAVVRWANAQIDWRWIGTAAAIIRTMYRTVCDSMQMSGVYNAYLLFRMSWLSDLPPPRLSFFQLLRLTRQFEVTDARDRVYGLLGMKTNDNDPSRGVLFLSPDYSISEAELWKRLAWEIINKTSDLSILSSVQYTTDEFDIGPKRVHPVPSWVPQWQRVYRSTLSPWDLHEAFATSRGLILNLSMQEDLIPDILKIEGIRVGLVGFTGYYMWHDVDTSLLAKETLGRFFASEAGLKLLARTYTAGRDAYGSLSDPKDTEALHDLLAYVYKLHSESKNADHQTYEELDFSAANATGYTARRAKNFQPIFDLHTGLQETIEQLARKGDVERFRATAVKICERRRLFLTLNGFLGLGPDNLREGDVVTVLAGSDVPILLRPIPKDNDNESSSDRVIYTSSTEQYLLVGECYMEGIMDGQALAAVEEGSILSGSIPTDLIFEEIMTYSRSSMPTMDYTDADLGSLHMSKLDLDDHRKDSVSNLSKSLLEERNRWTISKPQLQVFSIK